MVAVLIVRLEHFVGGISADLYVRVGLLCTFGGDEMCVQRLGYVGRIDWSFIGQFGKVVGAVGERSRRRFRSVGIAVVGRIAIIASRVAVIIGRSRAGA